MDLTAKVALIGAFVAALVSMFFGQTRLSRLANKLVNGYLDPRGWDTAFPELAEYSSFLIALSWGAIAVVLHELRRFPMLRR